MHREAYLPNYLEITMLHRILKISLFFFSIAALYAPKEESPFHQHTSKKNDAWKHGSSRRAHHKKPSTAIPPHQTPSVLDAAHIAELSRQINSVDREITDLTCAINMREAKICGGSPGSASLATLRAQQKEKKAQFKRLVQQLNAFHTAIDTMAELTLKNAWPTSEQMALLMAVV